MCISSNCIVELLWRARKEKIKEQKEYEDLEYAKALQRIEYMEASEKAQRLMQSQPLLSNTRYNDCRQFFIQRKCRH